ncbi:hypothetical protein F441_11937 [Phytophthora nicotianae CJ01A1]|uniref:Uncharacterized protein n=1 Tax=Phytophthora nicotianae CJ01A1 TaxID=1317063 RepID=W2WQE1_PHYNI|nr:hypothetical protein F441_11937 [Phytophthora nicotianae CJ01A1]
MPKCSDKVMLHRDLYFSSGFVEPTAMQPNIIPLPQQLSVRLTYRLDIAGYVGR